MIPKDLAKDYIVVFDRACDIDNLSVDVLTLKLNQKVLTGASQNLVNLLKKYHQLVDDDKQFLKDSYKKVSSKLNNQNIGIGQDMIDFLRAENKDLSL